MGLTRYVNRAHIVRAALEATAFQTREVLDAMNADSGVELSELRVDGGMTANEFLMQFQADILGVPVIRPKVVETTGLRRGYRRWFLDRRAGRRGQLGRGQALAALHGARRG